MPAMKVPGLGPDIKGTLNRDFPDKRDEQIAKIPSFGLGNLCTILGNFWSHVAKQGFTGNDQELIPASEVIKFQGYP